MSFVKYLTNLEGSTSKSSDCGNNSADLNKKINTAYRQAWHIYISHFL